MGGDNLAELRVPEVISGLGDDLIEFKRPNVYLVTGPDGPKVLKELRIGAEQAKLIGELLTYLKGSGLTPELIRPGSKRFYFWIKGARYFLTRYLPGRVADYYQLQDLQAAIRAMASLHQLTGRFLASHPLNRSIIKFDPARIWRKRLREMEICRNRAIRLRNHWSRQYLHFWYHYWNQALNAIEEIETLGAGQTEVVCYHDWAYHNLIINDHRAALFDFDDMIVDHPVHDRVNLISRYLRIHQWSREALFKALWNFDRYYPWNLGELRKLRVYLTFPYEFWIWGRQYFLERQPWPEKYYQDQWDRKVALFEQRIKILKLIEFFE
ncbi:MAG: phosphotransferase [Firmicutes bacterium]|nr:phosphotransferase [Bacillota bacterium]